MNDSNRLEALCADLERRLSLVEARLGLTVPSAQAVSAQSAPSPVVENAPITALMKSKRYHEADYMTGDASDRIDLELVFRNHTKKEIRAFKGMVVFKDLFDETILTVELTSEDALRAMSTGNWSGDIAYSRFDSSHVRLRSLKVEDLKLAFEVRAIIFADGSSQRFE